MEPFATKSLLLNLAWDHKLVVESITTDRSTSMKTMLEYEEKNNQNISSVIIYRRISAKLPPGYPAIQHLLIYGTGLRWS